MVRVLESSGRSLGLKEHTFSCITLEEVCCFIATRRREREEREEL